jgi:hypothetical protein
MFTDEVANQMQISHGSAYEFIRQRLHFQKVSARGASNTTVGHIAIIHKTWVCHQKPERS